MQHVKDLNSVYIKMIFLDALIYYADAEQSALEIRTDFFSFLHGSHKL